MITALTAIVAALAGAGVTAYINRRNTKDTLAVTRAVGEEQWNRTQEREHAVWLRNEKKEAYMSFLTMAQDLNHRLTSYNEDLLAEEVDIAPLTTCRGAIKILGGAQVRTLARDIDTTITRLSMARQEVAWTEDALAEVTEELHEKVKERFNRALARMWTIRNELSGLFIDYVEAVREDLGTSTDDDEEINKDNRAIGRPGEPLPDNEDVTSQQS